MLPISCLFYIAFLLQLLVQKHTSISEIAKFTSWYGKDETGINQITFERDSMIFRFHGQCLYKYPLKLTKEGLIMYWDNQPDCAFDVGLGKTFGLREAPKLGKPFARYNLLNDSTIKVSYFYPKWVREFNMSSKTLPDTVFRTILYAHKFE